MAREGYNRWNLLTLQHLVAPYGVLLAIYKDVTWRLSATFKLRNFVPTGRNGNENVHFRCIFLHHALSHGVSCIHPAWASSLLILYDHYFSGDDVDIEIFRRSFNRVLIPLYLHCRAYYMRTRWAPYSSVSFGGRLASKDCGLYFDFSTGVDWRINKDYHAYCSLGFWWSKFRFASGDNYESKNVTYYDDEDETCSSSDCPYRDRKYTNGDYYDHYHTTFYNIFRKKEGRGGLSFRIGISF